MTNLPNPDRMTWQRDGYTIWADEDGVHMRVTARSFEMPDAIHLMELYQQILGAFREGKPFGKPTPPTRDELRHYPGSYMADRAKRAAAQAIDAELDPQPAADLPF